ncbi:MAG: DUF4340 domain-containing protein [Flavobacteriales bacterium]|nr:DUF4340 domain-containing protein [Flavobacteriales bacterium]
MKKIAILLLIVLALAIVALYLSSSDNPFITDGIEQSDFAIEDTSSVGKIVIADRSGRIVKLTKEEGEWVLNEKYPARFDAVETLLKTFINIYIQRPVPKETVEQVSKVMASSAKKVEIYDLENDLIKTWYVGHATMDKKGTYMLLETPKYGKSSAPFIMDMKGFIGMLNTRFFLDENEWRNTLLLSYPEMDINKIEVEYPTDFGSSFSIEYFGENEILLFDGNDQKIPVFDTALVKDYMLNYRKLSFANFRTGLSKLKMDSIKSLTPYQVIRITDASGEYEFKLWPKRGDADALNIHMDSLGIDRQQVYASFNGGDLALAQRFMWDNFRAPLRAFAIEE